MSQYQSAMSFALYQMCQLPDSCRRTLSTRLTLPCENEMRADSTAMVLPRLRLWRACLQPPQPPTPPPSHTQPSAITIRVILWAISDVSIVRQLLENFIDASREAASLLLLPAEGLRSRLPDSWTPADAPRLFDPPG